MSKKYRSDAMAAIHETMEALHDVGAIGKQTMRRFDDACLTPIRPLKPEEIKAIREREHVSQTVFANYLNVTSSLVSKWERGEKRRDGLRFRSHRLSAFAGDGGARSGATGSPCGVRRFIDDSIAEVRRTGVTRTLLGRERPIPEIDRKS